VPSLRNQHYNYLVNEMHLLGDGRRHDADQGLVLFMRSFNEDEIAAVSDYLSRLHGPGTPHRRRLSNGIVVD
jgi:cytochrome c553